MERRNKSKSQVQEPKKKQETPRQDDDDDEKIVITKQMIVDAQFNWIFNLTLALDFLTILIPWLWFGSPHFFVHQLLICSLLLKNFYCGLAERGGKLPGLYPFNLHPSVYDRVELISACVIAGFVLSNYRILSLISWSWSTIVMYVFFWCMTRFPEKIGFRQFDGSLRENIAFIILKSGEHTLLLLFMVKICLEREMVAMFGG